MTAGVSAWELTGTTTLTAAFSEEKESSDVTRLIFLRFFCSFYNASSGDVTRLIFECLLW
jgi:hypothetical protein